VGERPVTSASSDTRHDTTRHDTTRHDTRSDERASGIGTVPLALTVSTKLMLHWDSDTSKVVVICPLIATLVITRPSENLEGTDSKVMPSTLSQRRRRAYVSGGFQAVWSARGWWGSERRTVGREEGRMRRRPSRRWV
jgi:hypothetical protein